MTSQSQTESWLIVRYSILALVILTLLGLFMLWRVDNVRIERFRLALLNEVIPKTTILTGPLKSVGRFFSNMASYSDVYKQNERLKLELIEMRQWRIKFMIIINDIF